MNPHNSPWNRPSVPSIMDPMLSKRWALVHKHLHNPVDVTECNYLLRINKQIFVAKKSSKFRLLSHLDWAWYTPKTLATAIDQNTVEQYYEFMLCDHRSDPNIWNDRQLEMELKSFYAARIGRASLI